MMCSREDAFQGDIGSLEGSDTRKRTIYAKGSLLRQWKREVFSHQRGRRGVSSVVKRKLIGMGCKVI